MFKTFALTVQTYIIAFSIKDQKVILELCCSTTHQLYPKLRILIKKNHPLWFSFWAFLFFFMRQVTTQILYKLFDFLNHLSSLYLPHTLYYLTLFFRIIYLNWVYWLFFSHFQKLSLVLLLYLSTYSIEAYGSPAPSMITVWKCPFTPCNCY